MSTLTLVVDERELSTIRAALLLLQEQVGMLPEDLAEMLREHGPAMTETEIERLSNRLSGRQDEPLRIEVLAEVERLPRAALSVK
jgi:hypothetical protein